MAYFGVDVSKAELVLAEHGVAGTQPFSNDRKGIVKLVRLLERSAAEAVVLEASGGYETALLKALAAAGIPVRRIHAQQGRAFQKALGRRAKTDDIDAAGLAQFASSVPTRNWQAPPRAVEEIRELSRQRNEVVALLTAQKCRIKQQDGLIKASTARLIRTLESEAKALEKLLAQRIERDQDLSERARLLRSIGGFKVINAAGLLGELPEIGSLKRTEIAALVGVAPMSRDSGSQSLKRRISGGRSNARQPLYLAALALIRTGRPLNSFYARLRAAGKPAKVAITACMRKLIVILNAMLRDRKPWAASPSVG